MGANAIDGKRIEDERGQEPAANEVKVGDMVRWVSSAGMSSNVKEKIGEVLALIPKSTYAFPLLPKGISGGQRKFDTDWNTVSDRVLVAVPRGGRSKVIDYYAPQLSRVRLYGVCRICNCTDNNACVTFGDPCYWVNDDHDLCSACSHLF